LAYCGRYGGGGVKNGPANTKRRGSVVGTHGVFGNALGEGGKR